MVVAWPLLKHVHHGAQLQLTSYASGKGFAFIT